MRMYNTGIPPTQGQVADALRHLQARPAPHLSELANGRLSSPIERAVRRVEDLQPAVARDAGRAVLVAAAHHQVPAGSCRWCLARLEARRHRWPLRVNATSRTLLPTMCEACQLVLDPPRAKANQVMVSNGTNNRFMTSPRPPAWLTLYAAAGPGPAGVGYDVRQAQAAQATLRRLGKDPFRFPHVTRVWP